jgi:hypothetical protein
LPQAGVPRDDLEMAFDLTFATAGR